MRQHRLFWIAVALAAAACGAPAHDAAPPPVPPRPEVTISAGAETFGLRADGGRTVVLALDSASGVLRRQTAIPGSFAFPEVAGVREGLSGDGGTLVLTEGPVAGARSRFALLPTTLTRPATVIDLPPGFAYDAVSPNAAVLYLIETRPADGPEGYAVRAYDVARGALREGVIADKRVLAEPMAGHPVARAAGPGGGIVATLYERAGEPPFVHVLHTAEGFAFCVDLPRDTPSGGRLAFAGGRVVVSSGAGRSIINPDDGTLAPVR